MEWRREVPSAEPLLPSRNPAHAVDSSHKIRDSVPKNRGQNETILIGLGRSRDARVLLHALAAERWMEGGFRQRQSDDRRSAFITKYELADSRVKDCDLQKVQCADALPHPDSAGEPSEPKEHKRARL